MGPGEDGVDLAESSGLIGLLRRARRRYIWHSVLAHAAQAASAGIAGAILLLILGTQILEWYWPLGILLVTSSFCAFGVWRRIPTLYRLAQWLDHRLRFHDSLSTAFFIGTFSKGRVIPEQIRKQELDSAERLAQSVDLRRAMPMVAPRALYASAALALVASGLFALRYGVSHTLDLRPPLVHIAFHNRLGPRQRASLKSPARQLPDILKEMGIPIDTGAQDKSGVTEGAEDARAQSVKVADANKDAASKGKSGNKANPGMKGLEQESMDGDPDDPDSPSAENMGADGKQVSSSNQSGAQSGESSGAPSSAKQNPGASNENSSLMNKFRDAMANLLSRLKIQPKMGDSRQSAKSSQSAMNNGNQRQSSAQKGTPGQGKNQSDGSPNGDPEGEDESNDGAQQAQASQGRHGSQSENQPAKEGKSGIGKDDGNKDPREAEQLAAMGKISEILGKRSKDVTGEVMVEVSSGKQQLETPYTQHKAAHMDAGAEIHRDEIPLLYQQYVQQYFEEVRKVPPPPEKK